MSLLLQGFTAANENQIPGHGSLRHWIYRGGSSQQLRYVLLAITKESFEEQSQSITILHLGTSHDGIDVTAWSPTGRSLPCPVKEKDGVHTATFQPDETGEWSIAITHKGNHIQGGPFTCFVFDPNGIKVRL
jgi:hypothetical protein